MPKEYPREPRIQGQAGIAPQDSPTDAPQDVGDLNNIGMHRTLMARDTELSHRADLEAGGGLTARKAEWRSFLNIQGPPNGPS